jgi:CheY-like chemotaxis protein
VLVVDDDPVIAELLARFLQGQIVVEAAQNGQEGLTKAREGFFDLVLSDIMMPVMDGLEFYQPALFTIHCG